ncbi:zinc finger protein 84-like isoform X2 [Pseudophryne corroboree]|uniref:zinc finger protein 84-like isoform X2 n=1 Tax=Pseudophryne corroboree TaxID=495146 RepID=UPI0030818188
MERALVTFEDVAIYFTEEEWKSLSDEQKSLYKEVMSANYQMILSLNRPDIISNIELGCEPFVISDPKCSSQGSWQYNKLLASETTALRERCYDAGGDKGGGSEPQVTRRRRYPRVNPVRWVKKEKKTKKRAKRSFHWRSDNAENRLTADSNYRSSPGEDDSDPCPGNNTDLHVADHSHRSTTTVNVDNERGPGNSTLGLRDKSVAAAGMCKKQKVSQESKLRKREAEKVTVSSKAPQLLGKQKTGRSGKGGEQLDGHTRSAATTTKNGPLSENVATGLKKVSSIQRNKSPSRQSIQGLVNGKKDSPQREDRRVKFNEVVTMFLIEPRPNEIPAVGIEERVKLRNRSYLSNLSEPSKSKKPLTLNRDIGIAAEDSWTMQEEDSRTSQDVRRAGKRTSTLQDCSLEQLEGKRVKLILVKCTQEMATVEESAEDTSCGMITRSTTGPAESPSKGTNKQTQPSGGTDMNAIQTPVGKSPKQEKRQPDTASEAENKVDTAPNVPQPSAAPSEQAFIKSYACANCGKVIHWSRLSDSQKKNIEQSLPHTCRRCGRRQTADANNVTASATEISTPTRSHANRATSGKTALPATPDGKKPNCSPATEKPDVSPAADNNYDVNKEKNEVKTARSGSSANRRVHVKDKSTNHRKKSLLCRKCKHGAPENPTIHHKNGTGASAKSTLANNDSSPGLNIAAEKKSAALVESRMQSRTGSAQDQNATTGLDSQRRRVGIKHKKTGLNMSAGNQNHETEADMPDVGKTRGICTNCGKHFHTVQKKHPLTSVQLNKPVKNRSLSTAKTRKSEDSDPESPKKSPHKRKTKRSRPKEDPRAPSHVKKTKRKAKLCPKCGKRLNLHVTPSQDNPGDESGGSSANCVLKKRKRPLEGMEPFTCKECGKIFTRHFTLLQHRMIHTGERPYACKECGKTFRDGGYLKVHMRLHTKEKPYTCQECGKRFCQNSAYMVHLRTHTDERPFECKECGKSFSDRSTFRHHERIHTGERPFPCSFCGKKFAQQSHVKRHEMIHTGERPYGCSHCSKRFIDRPKLRKHELIHKRDKTE